MREMFIKFLKTIFLRLELPKRIDSFFHLIVCCTFSTSSRWPVTFTNQSISVWAAIYMVELERTIMPTFLSSTCVSETLCRWYYFDKSIQFRNENENENKRITNIFLALLLGALGKKLRRGFIVNQQTYIYIYLHRNLRAPATW